MNAAVTVRKAHAADLPMVLVLYREIEADPRDVLQVDQAERLLAKFDAYPDYALYVAERDGRIVGTFALLVMDNLGHRGSPSGIIEDVAVAADAQGEGIGRAMMAQALDLCRAKGCYKVMLSSNARRERAHAFYERLGFDRHGYSFRADLKAVGA